VLRAVILPVVGGDTLWALMYAAYDALSSKGQRLVEDMRAIHDSSDSTVHARKAVTTSYQPTSHPVVRTHPVTGRTALFVDKTFTTRLEGLTDRENERLQPMLTDHVQSPDFQVWFHWSPGAVAV
jgi:taurine dioxygenase